MGKGYAVRTGLRAATMDLVLFMDADLSTALSCILDALKYARRLDKIYKNYILIGNREVSDSIIIASPMRMIIGRIFNNLQYLILGLRMTDTQCGFKLMPKHIIPRIINKLMIDGWAFDVELLYLCEQNNIFIDCMPVIWHDVVGSKIHPLRDSWRMFIELLRIRIIHGGKR
jgi:dolichyl-phosphate beta-glucosyltransferase